MDRPSSSFGNTGTSHVSVDAEQRSRSQKSARPNKPQRHSAAKPQPKCRFSRVQSSKFKVQSPKSKVQSPKSKVTGRGPESKTRLWKTNSLLRQTTSQIPFY